MSKLFDTLEQIRTHEALLFSKKKQPQNKKRKVERKKHRALTATLFVSCGVVALLVYYFAPASIDLKSVTQWSDLMKGEENDQLKGEQLDNNSKQRTFVNQQVESVAAPEQIATENGKPVVGSEKSSFVQVSEAVQLNNRGAEFIQKQDYWRGIYYLEQSIMKDPSLVAPEINIGVALSELGLSNVAIQHFEKAYSLDSQHPLILDNLAVLKQAGLLEGPLSVVMGEL